MADMFKTNSSSLLEDMQAEFERVNRLIERGGLPAGVADVLRKNRDSLQKSINTFLDKKKVLTQSDYDDAYDILRTSKKDEGSKNLAGNLIKLGAVILGIGVLYHIFKKKQ